MIVEFSDSFIDLIQSKYECDGNPQVLNNKRYYLFTVEIEGTPFYICIPLHSHGKYFVPIDPPSSNNNHWISHGLNLEKMLILKSNDFNDEVQISSVKNNVWSDIQSKTSIIVNKSKAYILLYFKCYRKRKIGQYLSENEKNILKYSALNHFPEYIEELNEVISDTTNFLYGGV